MKHSMNQLLEQLVEQQASDNGITHLNRTGCFQANSAELSGVFLAGARLIWMVLLSLLPLSSLGSLFATGEVSSSDSSMESSSPKNFGEKGSSDL
mmetsp:Transcript_37897/g.59131  ORF Transcript_37897/g.59131 Transcript_37897/m.59131 type:complete len:95 (+) Transcript_37897:227-511(+)